ncbi:MAG TPA: hypothetical protein VJ840_13040 [Gemmatimonadaceae bacterium]|nr:hypothetical protein [Gemmatimonadaceae bacterium]
MPLRLIPYFALTLTALACSSANQTPSDAASDKIVLTGDQKSDWDQITTLENQAKTLVKTDGCSSADQCRTAPVGSRGCGGPRYYLVYCSKTTDSAALFKKLAAIAAAEKEFNTRYQIGSTCEMRMPPTVALVGSSCQASNPPVVGMTRQFLSDSAKRQ